MNAWREWLVRAVAGAAALCGGTGCGKILDVPDDPRFVASGPWRCLEQPAGVEVAPNAAQAKVRVQACDFITDCTTHVSGLTAKLCDKRDVGCNNPRLSNITEIDGEFRFDVPTPGAGFEGYLRVDSKFALCTDAEAFGAVAGARLCSLLPACNVEQPNEACALPIFAPAMLFFNPPIARDIVAPVSLQMMPSAGLPAVISAAGIELDQTAGNLLIQAFDCDGVPASGVSYALTQDVTRASPLYVDNGVVSRVVTQTDRSGIGGFVSIPPGFISAVGYTSDGLTIGEIGVQTAPSTLTYSALAPPL